MRLLLQSTAAAVAAAFACTRTTTSAAFQINKNPVVIGSSSRGTPASRTAQAARKPQQRRHADHPLAPLAVSSTTTAPEEIANNKEQGQQDESRDAMPELGEDGIYHLTNPDQHAALMEFAQDKLVILKVFAPWCRACKGLEPKFQKLTTTPEYTENVPIIFASLSIQHNKAFVQSLGVLALPTVQFYVGGQIMDTFPCGPSKVPMMKQKLTALIQDHVEDGKLKAASIEQVVEKAEEAALKVKQDAVDSPLQQPAATMSAEERKRMESIPYFSSLSLADKDQVLDKAVQLTFEPGSILMREGRPGRTFYVIQSGEVEICQHSTLFADPMVQAPEGYLGSVVNRLEPGDFFGERALITGEPRAASLRVGTEPVTLWAFDQDVFPASCVLSGKSKNTALPQQADLNEKYGVELSDTASYTQEVLSKQMRESATASQVRGSVNTPEPLASDEVVSIPDEQQSTIDVDEVVDADFLVPAAAAADKPQAAGMVTWTNDDAIFSLLTRFQMIRHVSTCFKYIQETRAVWGDPGSRTRRSMLASRLSQAQQAEFAEIFQLMDTNGDGFIDLDELKRVMESIGEDEAELKNVLRGEDVAVKAGGGGGVQSSNSSRPTQMTFEDYIGLMAEAEFYHLFRDIFASLDEQKSGFVKARELDRVLCGVRDLISDDRKSVIDVDDKDMLIDYEQFSRMLLGTTLL